MQRIEEFLKEDEVPEWASSLKNQSAPAERSDEVGFAEAVFGWNAPPGKNPDNAFQLGPLDFTFPKGKLTLVSGSTGSGKTALLLSLLGGEFEHFGRWLQSDMRSEKCTVSRASLS